MGRGRNTRRPCSTVRRSGLGQDAAGQARRDARSVRARRDQRPDQRAAPRRRLELTARDRLLPPGADRLPPRLPAAHRPDHADALAQGGRRRRRLRDEGLDAQRPRDLAALPARRRLLPRGSARHPRSTAALSSVARAGSLSPVPWLVPVTPDVIRRLAVIQREWQRIDPKFLDDEEQRFWATIAGRQIRFDQRTEFARKFTEGRAGKGRSRPSSPSAPPRTRTVASA